jgi:hypothetical protein
LVRNLEERDPMQELGWMGGLMDGWEDNIKMALKDI